MPAKSLAGPRPVAADEPCEAAFGCAAVVKPCHPGDSVIPRLQGLRPLRRSGAPSRTQPRTARQRLQNIHRDRLLSEQQRPHREARIPKHRRPQQQSPQGVEAAHALRPDLGCRNFCGRTTGLVDQLCSADVPAQQLMQHHPADRRKITHQGKTCRQQPHR